jgi:HSP90 family molecular chaperone
METANEQITAAPAGENSSTRTGPDVGGLIAAVESKMAELMAWHSQQVKQFEVEKTQLQAKTEQEKQAIEAEKKTLAERMAQVDQQRIKLVELTSKLRAEESAMSREWADVQREREAIQRQANEIAEQRQRTEERAKAWLETTASDLSQPLKFSDAQAQDKNDNRDSGDEQHHAA